MRTPNPYAGGGLDRAAHLRNDSGWLAERLAAEGSRFVPVWRTRNLVRMVARPEAIQLAPHDVEALVAASNDVAFLGLAGDVAHFAIDVSDLEDPLAELAVDGVFEDLRNVGPLLERDEGAMLAYARGLFSWHRRHRYCGVCGERTRSAQAGHTRVCTNDACAAQHFPRIDPAIIVLVHRGEYCLLGRQATWPKGMHSTLAGFVETGESLEDAVAREVKEESAIDVTDVRYHSSQPWPFPSSLMLGFHARALNDEISVYEEELEDVRWFSRAELRDSPEDERFRLPRRDSIARRLIEDWIAEGS
jgi:NAD+ diphosphatase